jgi:hypothetical protein
MELDDPELLDRAARNPLQAFACINVLDVELALGLAVVDRRGKDRRAGARSHHHRLGAGILVVLGKEFAPAIGQEEIETEWPDLGRAPGFVADQKGILGERPGIGEIAAADGVEIDVELDGIGVAVGGDPPIVLLFPQPGQAFGFFADRGEAGQGLDGLVAFGAVVEGKRSGLRTMVAGDDADDQVGTGNRPRMDQRRQGGAAAEIGILAGAVGGS